MPVVWTTETEAKLLAGMFQICDIKVTQAQKVELAKLIGPECTPKAITHRLDKFKKSAAGFAPKGIAPVVTPKKQKKDAGVLRGIKEGEKGRKRKLAELAAKAAEEEVGVEEEDVLAAERGEPVAEGDGLVVEEEAPVIEEEMQPAKKIKTEPVAES